MSTRLEDREAPDLVAIERNLRRWSWAAGGWESVHAVAGFLHVVTGGLADMAPARLRVVSLVAIASWATAGTAAWQFRRSFHARVGVTAAVASIIAGIALLGIAVGLSSSTGLVDGASHVYAGIGLARAVKRARPYLLFG